MDTKLPHLRQTFGNMIYIAQNFAFAWTTLELSSTINKKAQHLIDALSAAYGVTVDWSGTNYKRKHVDVVMPDCVKSTLEKLQHQ